MSRPETPSTPLATWSPETPFPDSPGAERRRLIPVEVSDPEPFPESPRLGRRRRHRAATWTFEVVCAGLSIAAMIAIAAVLRAYDGQPLATWELRLFARGNAINISLNSVIAVLGTFAKSTMAVVLSSGLSQSKWNWFASNRRMPLRDFELFDSASRGPQGSVQLLWRTGARRLASLGAFLTILSLTFDPLLQLLISYPGSVQSLFNGSARLDYADRYDWVAIEDILEEDVYDGASSLTYDPTMIAAMWSGLWNMAMREKPAYTCQSGNCTWPPYVSLAVCSSCLDMTDQLTTVNDTKDHLLTYKLDNKLEIMNSFGFIYDDDGWGMNLTATFLPADTFHFQESQTLLLSLAAIVADRSYFANLTAWQHTPFTALECGLVLCVNTYNSTVQNGNFSETIVESTSQRLPSSWGLVGENSTVWDPIGPGLLLPFRRNDFQLEPSAEQARIAGASMFTVSEMALRSLVYVGASIFGVSSDNGTSETPLPVVDSYSMTMQALWTGTSIPVIFANMATDLTAALRNSGLANESWDGSASAPLTLTGTSTQFTVLIAVRWGVLVVPLLICSLGVVFLAAAIVETRRARTPVWKDRALPGLVWGLDGATRRQARFASGFRGGDGDTRVVFRGDMRGGELVQ